MSEQLQLRRGTSTQLVAFTGAQGEAIFNETTNRLHMQDGATAGGWPHALLADLPIVSRTPISDANYTALVTDRNIAYTALTAARIVTLPTAASFPVGIRLAVIDEAGACSATNTVTVNRSGSDTINGGASAVIASAYGYLALESNGASKWTVLDLATLSMAQQNAGAVAITGGVVNGTTIGATTPAAGAFTSLSATLDATIHGMTVGFGTGAIASNLAIGFDALLANTTGSYNVALGANTLVANTTGAQNVAVGSNVLISNTTGTENVGLGQNSLYFNTIGSYNIAIGETSLHFNTAGNTNLGIGIYALHLNTTGGLNIGLGPHALCSSTTSSQNIGIGSDALFNLTTGIQNIGIGTSALQDLAPTSTTISAFANYSGTIAGTVKATTSAASGYTTGQSVWVHSTNGLYDGQYTITVIDADDFYFTATYNSSETSGYCTPSGQSQNNVAIGYNTGRGITTGNNNTILGSNVTGLSATLSGNIILADGSGTARAQWSGTSWTLLGNVGIGAAPAQPLDVAGTIQTHGGHGSSLQLGLIEDTITCSGAASVSTQQIPNRALVVAVSVLVVSAITGATSFNVDATTASGGGTGTTAGQFGSTLGIAAGSSNVGVIGPTAWYVASTIKLTATGGTFTGGTVRISIQYLLPNAPTS